MGIRTRLARRHRPNTLDTVKGEQIKSNRQPDCIVVIAECKTHPNQIRFNPSKRSSSMKDKDSDYIELLLENLKVQEAVSNINRELVERRGYIPPKCKVFESPFTLLKDDDRFTFNIDKEAKKQLPDIINNKVRAVVGVDSPEESFKDAYGKKRRIGIVFPGDRRPAGTM